MIQRARNVHAQRQRKRRQEPKTRVRTVRSGEGKDLQSTMTEPKDGGMVEMKRPKKTMWNCSSTHRLRRLSAMYESMRQKKRTCRAAKFNLASCTNVSRKTWVNCLTDCWLSKSEQS